MYPWKMGMPVADTWEYSEGGHCACPFCGAASAVDLSKIDEDSPCPNCGRILWFVRKPHDEVAILIFLPGLVSGSESLPRLDEVLSVVAGVPRVAVDLSRLRVITSMFLGMLVSLQRKLTAAQGKLKVFGVPAGQRSVFVSTRLDTVLDIHPDEASALASF